MPTLKQDGATSTLYFSDRTNWEDLRFPVTALNPPGAVSDPDIDPDDGTLLFDPAGTERAVGIAQMPHSWALGTPLCPHIHWQATDASEGSVLWRLEYDKAEVGGSFSGTWTSVDCLQAAPGDANKHMICDFEHFKVPPSVSTIIKWRISRIGGDETDTYAADARLLEFDIHYQIDAVGSGQEYIK